MISLNDFAFIYARPVVWADVDGLGHVNNIRYYDYSQEARIRHINVILPDTLYTVVVATSCQYLSEVFYPDTLQVGVRIKSIGTTSITHEFVYHSNAQNKTVATAESVIVLMDKTTRQKTPISDELRVVLERSNKAPAQ